MQEVVTALGEQHDELAGILRPLDDDGWGRQSACEAWTVADVVIHLAQTDEIAIGSATGRFPDALRELAAGIGPAVDVDEGADQMVARDRGGPPAAVLERWERGAAGLRQALLEREASDRVTWVVGEMSARTLATTRLAETWIHTGDVLHAFGRRPQPSRRLWHIARLAWRTVPYALGREGRELSGPVAFDLAGPDGERWRFDDGEAPATTISGDALDLCLVAGRRAAAADTSLRGEGPDAAAVLELVRTYA